MWTLASLRCPQLALSRFQTLYCNTRRVSLDIEMASRETDEGAPAPAGEESDFAPTLLPPLTGDLDADSTYSGSIAGSETTSLKSSIAKYREENGRTYHAFGSTEHWGPNDESAQDQQDLSHHLWVLTLKGELYLAPIKTPQQILDLGTGTGYVVGSSRYRPRTLY